MPDEFNGGGTPSSAAPAAAPAASPPPSAPAPSPSSPPAASSAPAPQSSGGTAAGSGSGLSGQPASAAPAAAQWTGVRDALRGYGLDPASFADDHAALAALVNGYQQARQYAPMIPKVQDYLQHADQFGGWMREQEAARAKAEAEKNAWWKAPQFDPSWERFLQRDATGQIVATPDAPPGIVDKFRAAQAHQRDFLQKFAFDPMAQIKPGIEQVAREIAEKIVAEKLGGYQVNNQAQTFIQENSGWLHSRDDQGRLLADAQGQPLLSEWGQRFQGYLERATKMGITDYEARKDFALTAVQRDYLHARTQQGSQSVAAPTAPTPAGDPSKEQFLQQAAARRGGAAAATNQPPGAAPVAPGLSRHSLAARMLADLNANGFAAGQTIEGRR